MLERVKVYPTIGLAAKRKHSGAWRAWVFASNLDGGEGRVDVSELRDELAAQGVHPETARRWINSAVAIGLFSRAGKRLYKLGVVKVAYLFGVENIGRPVYLDASKLIGKGWRSYLWAAYNASLNGRPMSQRTKKHLVGVSTRSQRRYQSRVGGVRRNYCKSELSSKFLEVVRQLHPGAFNWRGVCAWQLPDIRTVDPSIAQLARRGSQRKYQSRLTCLFGQLGKKSIDGKRVRLFHAGEAVNVQGARDAAKRTAQRAGRERMDVQEVYHLVDTRRRGRNVWGCVAVDEFSTQGEADTHVRELFSPRRMLE